MRQMAPNPSKKCYVISFIAVCLAVTLGIVLGTQVPGWAELTDSDFDDMVTRRSWRADAVSLPLPLPLAASTLSAAAKQGRLRAAWESRGIVGGVGQEWAGRQRRGRRLWREKTR